VLALLWEAGRKTEFTCGACGATFGVRGFFARLSIGFFWFLVILMGLGVWQALS
jgi:hypothetical protein